MQKTAGAIGDVGGGNPTGDPRAGAGAWIAVGALMVVLLAAAAVMWLGYGAVFVAAALASFATMSAFALRALPRHHRHPRFGLANAITLLRGGLVCLLLGALAEDTVSPGGPQVDPLLAAALGVLVVSLDGVDGFLARRQKLTSDFGARFDMEVDALLMLLLSVWVAREGIVGPWVVAIGALRYVFVAVSWAMPRLAAPLPGSVRRKAVCVLQGLVLCLVLSPFVPPAFAPPLAAVALAALVWSFAVDIVRLMRGGSPAGALDSAAAIGLARSLIVYYGQPWRRVALRRHYRAFIAPGMLAFDLGAHVGNRTRTLAALGARVVAVEPQPLYADILARLAPARGTVIVREAVGARTGTATLRVSSRHPTVSTLSRDWMAQVGADPGFRRVDWDRTVEVRVTTLDALIARFGMPDFVKIDVEGMEAEILEGLGRPVSMVAFEALAAAGGIARDCVDRLEALGDYRFNMVAGESHRFLWSDWRDGAAVRAALAEWARSGRSGDVYARLSPAAAASVADDPRRGAITRKTAPGRLPASTTSP